MDKENKKSDMKIKSDTILSDKNISEGMKLEVRSKRLLFHMGYFPIQGVILKSGLGEDFDVITDLDVYGIYIHRDFRKKTIWLDCKSGFSKPLERISWIKGVKHSFDIDESIFINRKMRLITKQYAMKAGIQLFDKSMLEKIEANYNIEENDWYGSWNPEISGMLKEFSNLNIPDKHTFKKIGDFISSEYWVRDPFTQLKKCLTAFKTLSKVPYEVLPYKEKKAYKWGLYFLTELFTLSLLNICKDLYFLEEKDRKQLLLEGILSSDIPLKRRNEIYQSAISFANELVKDKYPNAQIKSDNFINITAPNYFEAIEDLIKRIISDPLTYFDILRSMDLLFMEFDINQKQIDVEFITHFCPNYQINERGIKTILHLICQITNISRENYQLIS